MEPKNKKGAEKSQSKPLKTHGKEKPKKRFIRLSYDFRRKKYVREHE